MLLFESFLIGVFVLKFARFATKPGKIFAIVRLIPGFFIGFGSYLGNKWKDIDLKNRLEQITFYIRDLEQEKQTALMEIFKAFNKEYQNSQYELMEMFLYDWESGHVNSGIDTKLHELLAYPPKTKPHILTRLARFIESAGNFMTHFVHECDICMANPFGWGFLAYWFTIQLELMPAFSVKMWWIYCIVLSGIMATLDWVAENFKPVFHIKSSDVIFNENEAVQ